MKAVIMAGGEGSRLHPLTPNPPKPMVTIANRFVMGHIVEFLTQYHIDELWKKTQCDGRRKSGSHPVLVISSLWLGEIFGLPGPPIQVTRVGMMPRVARTCVW